eukprot:TRINITY_DN779986_c0_g1_i1.p1 TRINITY_DN779986_c0_g1~~TRINITY_DN779986_c0_g1_i1.p1  ORF type:complete len:233 (+),score=72.42 TRINITY_DN779986_c0_g1_i1:115-813(+)
MSEPQRKRPKVEFEDKKEEEIEEMLNVEAAEEDARKMKFDDDIEITPFNLESVREEGRFNADGGFEYNKDEVHLDVWMKDTDEKTLPSEIPEEHLKKYAEFEQESEKIDVVETIKELVDLLEEDESPSEAIRRYAKSELDKLDLVTEAANKLLDSIATIYEMKKGALMTRLPAEDQWEYRWMNPETKKFGEEVFGPSSTTEMRTWKEQGFLSNALVRREGTEEWINGDDLDY